MQPSTRDSHHFCITFAPISRIFPVPGTINQPPRSTNFMPTLTDEPELRFTRILFEQASCRPANENPHSQLGAWTVFQRFVRAFEQTFVRPVESPTAEVMQIYRAGLTCVLGMGEHLLTLDFPSNEKAAIEAVVRSFRDKLVIEFSDATPAQSEKLLATIFGEGTLAG